MFCALNVPNSLAKTVLLAGTAVVVLLPKVAGGDERAAESWDHDWPAAWKQSQASGRPILLFITSEHCYYCDKMNRETYRDDDVRDELDSRFVTVAIDSDDHPRLVRKLNIETFPTTLIVGPDAYVIDTVTGYLSPQQMRSRLKRAGEKLAAN